MAYCILAAKEAVPESIEYLKDKGYIIKHATSYDENALFDELRFCDGYLMQGGSCSLELLQRCERLKVIGKDSVGLDMIDLAGAEKLGIWVTNARGANSRSTAEHTVAMLLACAKNLVTMDSLTRAGMWPRQDKPTLDLHGKALGIIGLGAIGAIVAQMASEGFDMKIIAYDCFASSALKDKYTVVEDLNYLLANSDFITLHVPLNDETRGMIGAKELSLMKKTAFILNCARGAVIDEGALYAALYSRQIRGAAIDAFTHEPVSKADPLLSLDNVIVTPHNAAFTEETIVRMWMHAAIGIHEVLSGKRPSWPGNNPLNPRMPLKAETI